jgi:hypothetical protein
MWRCLQRVCCCFFFLGCGWILFFSYKLLTFWVGWPTQWVPTLKLAGMEGEEICRPLGSIIKYLFDLTYIHTLFKDHVHVIHFLLQAKNKTTLGD